MKPGDWNCPKCKNHNFAKRDVCNRCDTRKPVAGKGSRKTPEGSVDPIQEIIGSPGGEEEAVEMAGEQPEHSCI